MGTAKLKLREPPVHLNLIIEHSSDEGRNEKKCVKIDAYNPLNQFFAEFEVMIQQKQRQKWLR